MKKTTLILSFFLPVVACVNQKTNPETSNTKNQEHIVTLTSEQINNAGIKTGQLNKQNISSVLKLNGKIDVPPQNLVSISMPMGGYIKSTKLLSGMHVKKGEVLGMMQDLQYIQIQQDYLTSKAQLTLAESDYNRQKELNQSKASSDKSFEQAKANYETQLILIKSLSEKLNLMNINPQTLTHENISGKINIYAPITGYVSKVNVNIGKYVTPGEVIFELINPSDIHLSLTVFEKDIGKISVGQKLIAYNNYYPNKKYECEIILISNNLEENNSAQIHCHFMNYDNSLIPGMFMNAEIEIKENSSYVLPEDAIVRFEGKYYAFIATNNNKFEMTEILIGNSQKGYTEILNPEKFMNVNFVIEGSYYLVMAIKNNADAH